MTTASFDASPRPLPVSYPVPYPSLDPLLVPFIHAPDEQKARAHLDSLIHHYADPVIQAAVRRHAPTAPYASSGISSGDDADLRNETIRILLMRIGAIRYDGACPITDFLAYVKVTARHLCWHHTRKARRERAFSSFRRSGDDNLDFEEVADTIAAESCSEGTCDLIEQRGFLQAVWMEVCALPRTQRMALLYNFRDKNGANALPLLPLCSVATPDELAGALDVPVPDLEMFLDQLPLEDSQIAASLGVSAREVINLRVAARRRLKRRIRAWLEPAAQE